MPRFCNKTFKRRKFGANYKDSSASENLNKEQPASMYIKNSSSKSKLGKFNDEYVSFLDSSENFCEIIDIPLFSSVLKQHVLCVKCKKQGIDIKFGRQIQGLATELLICCEFCGLIQPLLNTRFTNTVVNKKDTKVYEVNTRLAYAMRSVGKGEAAAKVFCGVMNLPPPPKRFYESLHALNNATEKVAKVSMALAAAETLSFNNGNPNVPVAIDGTWQKRGHTSLNGVVTAVSVDTGKVIDAEILSRKCSCHFNGNLHSDECSANYFGNSGGMEVEGALRIFNRSEVLHNLRYTQYLGDGDSKAYKAVLESKPYKDVNIEKLECVGHVEKRMGTRLRALKLKLKGKKLEDKESLGGRNRLTDAEIDKLQRYYGLAIRNNSGNLSAMKQAIWAIFFHKISTDLNPQHGLCPLGDDSWCGYNRSKLKGDTYKHKHNLPIAIMHCIKKVFRDLSSPELLSRCLHGKTQNCNESLNSVIWSIIPKTVFVQLGTLKTGVYESISIYNQGLITKLKVLDLLNIQPGFYTCRALQEADHARIRKAEKAISRRTKEARIKNRQLKCRQEDDLADDLSNQVMVLAANADLLGACHLAQIYHVLTGDEQVPVLFALVSVEGNLPKRVDHHPIRRLYAIVKILKALNAPFTQNATIETPTVEMQHFLTDYMNAITHAKPQEQLKDSEKMVLNHLIQNLHQAMESKEFQDNKFDFYFQKLIPYVKACREDWTPLPPEEE
ncbi:uncharacterized protein TNCV_875101 [Trichonephila clavipes]|nr:uncharacterized protein TNCV_875101 [Trichonephila clavipes]